MPLISVIVPVYNVEQYLHRCVDSILAQTFGDFELILVDDGSPDGCPAICDEYAEKDSRVRVIHQENGGISAARNAAICWCEKNSDSEWITFVDSDDLIHSQMLELLYKAVSDYHADISLCSVIESSEIPTDFANTQNPIITCHKVNEAYILDLYMRGKQKYWTAWAKLVRKSMAVEMQFEEGRIFEDNNLIFKWLCESQRIAEMDAQLYFYYVNQQGISKGQFTLRHLDWLHALETQASYYRERKYEMLHNCVVSNYVTSAHSMFSRVKDELKDQNGLRKIKKDLRRFCVENRSVIQGKSQIYVIAEILHPQIIRCYRIIKDNTKGKGKMQ